MHGKQAAQGDIFVANNAYFAMIDTLIGVTKGSNNNHNYKQDFNALCSPSVGAGVAAGCAMFAVNFVGGDDRSISAYFYQVSEHICISK